MLLVDGVVATHRIDEHRVDGSVAVLAATAEKRSPRRLLLSFREAGADFFSGADVLKIPSSISQHSPRRCGQKAYKRRNTILMPTPVLLVPKLVCTEPLTTEQSPLTNHKLWFLIVTGTPKLWLAYVIGRVRSHFHNSEVLEPMC